MRARPSIKSYDVNTAPKEFAWLFEKKLYKLQKKGQGNGFSTYNVIGFRTTTSPLASNDELLLTLVIKRADKKDHLLLRCFISLVDETITKTDIWVSEIWDLFDGNTIMLNERLEIRTKRTMSRQKHKLRVKQQIIDKFPERFL